LDETRARVLGFEDLGTEEERVAVFRRVRDAIAARRRTWLAEETRNEMNV